MAPTILIHIFRRQQKTIASFSPFFLFLVLLLLLSISAPSTGDAATDAAAGDAAAGARSAAGAAAADNSSIGVNGTGNGLDDDVGKCVCDCCPAKATTAPQTAVAITTNEKECQGKDCSQSSAG